VVAWGGRGLEVAIVVVVVDVDVFDRTSVQVTKSLTVISVLTATGRWLRTERKNGIQQYNFLALAVYSIEGMPMPQSGI
jgi:hypothetical protein